MPRIMVIGSGSFIGHRLMEMLHCPGTSRADLDLLDDTARPPDAKLHILCAAVTGFDVWFNRSDAYRVNVDAPLRLAKQCRQLVFLSSVAVETGLHCNYGKHKALAEAALYKCPNVAIARILNRVTARNLDRVCRGIIGITEPFYPAGVHRIQ